MSGQLKEVRTRIKSIQSTQQITKAMKMVSAAKLKKAQNALINFRLYYKKLRNIYFDISLCTQSDESRFNHSKNKSVNKVALVVIGGDRGLCGGYNSSIIKTTQELIKKKYSDQNKSNNLEIVCVGKKSFEFFSKKKLKVNAEFKDILLNFNYQDIFKLGDYLIGKFLDGEFDAVEVVYSKFKNASVQTVTSELLLPFDIKEEVGEKVSLNDFIFQSNKEEFLNKLIPKIIVSQILSALFDARASEHGARMIAMDKATDNSNEILKKLKVSYNRARQSSITTELSEVVAGSAALES